MLHPILAIVFAFIGYYLLLKIIEKRKRPESSATMFGGFPGFERDESYNTRYKRSPNVRPKFVRLHPRDNGNNLDNVFYQDPVTFVPKKSQFGQVLNWGLFDYCGGYPDVDGMGAMMRTMETQMLYFGGEPKKPEIQFVEALIKKKKAALNKLDLGDLRDRDYILKIKLLDIPIEPVKIEGTYTKGQFGEDLIYRRFKVSGATNLDALQDKIIQPIMGWERNAHAYAFMDSKDGACYGPKESRSIDMVHIDKCCHDYIYADEYTLAHLVQEKGATFRYVYDFGDMWSHEVEVEDILPKKESNGAVELIDGRGMCPPENGSGNRRYVDDLYNLKHGTREQKKEAIEKIKTAGNNRDLKITLATFDHKAFSASRTRDMLAAALKSKASVRSGAKVFTMPMMPGVGPGAFDGPMKRGEKRVHEYDPTFSSVGYMSETVRTRRDRLEKALCTVCGSPHNLKACSVCKKVYYCGRDHQREDWKTHKPECKPAEPKSK
ncbi:hypothetical protein SCHPADRAFT_854067 [Schizopora paradoxa]|uniref:MYND-type domain-containing protein n=1 Tax=Schizopora paradoxa TaxID=27342 RepID=A0A0H2RJZ3_9AGAM|nr:hypothetical protein SCHPADRAFT_854067 [Schizopora paradoxa]